MAASETADRCGGVIITRGGVEDGQPVRRVALSCEECGTRARATVVLGDGSVPSERHPATTDTVGALLGRYCPLFSKQTPQ